MFDLPKGTPLWSGVTASKESVPDVLRGLAQARFTGYARYGFSAWRGFLLFHQGRLLSLRLTADERSATELEGLTELCHRVTSEDGQLAAYRLDEHLTTLLLGLFRGEPTLHGQALRFVDVHALSEQLRTQHLTGCVRVYTEARSTLIFYRDGSGYGFFHDGTEHLETTATAAQRLAGAPGAKMDIFATRDRSVDDTPDLLEVIHVERIWANAVRANEVKLARLAADAREAERIRLEGQLVLLEQALKDVAAKCIGTVGTGLVTKELLARGGRTCLADPAQVPVILGNIDKGARLVAGTSRVKELHDRLLVEVDRYLPAGNS